MAVRVWHPSADLAVLPSFFHPPLKPGHAAVQVGPLLRPEVIHARPTRGDHILSYLRPHTPGSVLELLAHFRRDVCIYGLGQRPSVGTLHFKELNAQTFAEDLASCRGVIAASGHQLLSESVYFRKPVLALPEERHHEQEINGFHLQQMGGGLSVSLNRLNESHVREFRERLDEFSTNLEDVALDLNGTEAVVNLVRSRLAPKLANSIRSGRAEQHPAPIAAAS